MLNAISLHYSWWRKKKVKYYIIPPNHFNSTKHNKIANVVTTTTATSNSIAKQQITAPSKTTELPKIVLNNLTKRTSGLSLSSIKAKKEHQIKKAGKVVVQEKRPTNKFTEEELQKVWNTYVEKIERKREFNLASILSIDTPTLNGTETVIHLTFPNSTNQVELERNQYNLLKFLKEELQNFDITFSIDINEVLEKKYAYTPAEKYEKLKEKNPDIELLKQAFNLDL